MTSTESAQYLYYWIKYMSAAVFANSPSSHSTIEQTAAGVGTAPRRLKKDGYYQAQIGVRMGMIPHHDDDDCEKDHRDLIEFSIHTDTVTDHHSSFDVMALPFNTTLAQAKAWITSPAGVTWAEGCPCVLSQIAIVVK